MKHTWDGYRLAAKLYTLTTCYFVGCQPAVPARFAGQKAGDMMKCNQALAEPRLAGICILSAWDRYT